MSARKKHRNRRRVETRNSETVEKKKENRYNIVLTETKRGNRKQSNQKVVGTYGEVYQTGDHALPAQITGRKIHR